MSNKLIQWNGKDQEPDQELDDSMLPADPPGHVPSEPDYESSMEAAVDAFVEDEEQEELNDAEILSNARLRLETGRLYEMLYASDIFGNLDADPQAVKNVQREMKRFAKERMEVMLGMKKPIDTSPVYVQSQAQFNSLEVDVLKSLAKKLSGGASEKSEGPQPPPKSTILTPISNNSLKTTKVPAKSAVKMAVSNLNKKPAKAESVNEISPELTNKPIEEMSYDEKVEYNRQKSALYNARKTQNPSTLPMPGYDGLNALNSKGTAAVLNLGHPTLNKIAAGMLKG